MFSILLRGHPPCAVSSLLLVVLLSAHAHAQSPSAIRLDPLDPEALVPSVRHESSFALFRRVGDDKPVGWRQANDAVAGIGGWRVYAREAQQPEPAPAPAQPIAPAPAAAVKPMPPVHAGHKR